MFPKLLRVQRKIRKLKKTLNTLPLPKMLSVEIFKRTTVGSTRMFKDHSPVRRHIILRKNYYIINKFKRDNFNYAQEGLLGALGRYFNILAMSFDRGDKANITFLQRGKSKLKQLYIRTKSDSMKTGNSNWDNKTINELHGSAKLLDKSSTLDSPFKTFNELYNGTLEQKYYTGSRQTLYKGAIDDKKDDKKSMELPPPAKCRLSCPLPPPGYNCEEKQEYLPRFQSPLVKFGNQPEVFIPPEKRPSSRQDQYSPNLALTPKSQQKPPPSPDLITGTPLTPSKKIYPSAPKNFKSQMYLPHPVDSPKMKALLLGPDYSSFNIQDVNIPTYIFKDEVLVQVIYSGVNVGDLDTTEKKRRNERTPIILGQEISGRVYAAGSEVHHVKTDDHVAINPYTACLVCRYCARGQYDSCLNEGRHNSIGVGKDGGWAEFVVVKKNQTHKIPESLGLDRAVLVQSLSRILSAISKLKLAPSMDILVQGGGINGFLWALALHFKGYRNVFVSDKCEKKRQQFQNLNLNFPSVPTKEIDKYSADVIIECSGCPESIEKCIQTVNPQGQICFFGKPNIESEIRFAPHDLVHKEVTIVGTSGNTFWFSNAIEMAATMGYKYLNFNKLGVKVFKLKDYEHAFELNRSGEVGKVIFKLGN